MSSDIVKEAVFDGRIIQSRPKYAVEKGALSITNAPFAAISQSSSQHTYNIYVPSENVFVDRALEWTSTAYLSATWNNGAQVGADAVFVQPGENISLCAFPLNALCSTMTTTINDTTSVINSQDVQREVLRLTDYKHNRVQRTCPTMLDVYLKNSDANAVIRDSGAGYNNSTNVDLVGNGAFPTLLFTTPSGSLNGNYTFVVGATTYTLEVVDGQLSNSATPIPLADAGAIPIYLRFTTTEKLVLSPFVFADTHETDTGLFGINNIQLIMNLRSPQDARVLRVDTQGGVGLSNVQFNANRQPFENSFINTQFLTPSLETALPPKSVVPYMEFPRYITTNTAEIEAGATDTISSQTITLPQIPDLLIIYCKATQAVGVAENPQSLGYGDGYLPLDVDGKSPLSIQFDNFSGLLSSHTAQQLYAMSVRNGLEMDYLQWLGKAYSSGALVPLTGGFLVLKPSIDITLQSGQAPSLVGNFTLQFNIRVKNNYGFKVKPTLYVITANSGFFESIRGSSRIIKGVLSEQDIISAPVASTATTGELKRVVGGKGLLSNLGNILSKARDVYHATKPALSALKPHMPEGVRGAMDAVGYGSGGMSGGRSGGRSGGMSGGKKHSIADRLM
jgi:hypothetical protein